MGIREDYQAVIHARELKCICHGIFFFFFFHVFEELKEILKY